MICSKTVQLKVENLIDIQNFKIYGWSFLLDKKFVKTDCSIILKTFFLRNVHWVLFTKLIIIILYGKGPLDTLKSINH